MPVRVSSRRLLLLLLVLAGCVEAAPAPRARKAPRRLASPTTVCEADGAATLRCRFAPGQTRAWPEVRSHALRPRGGVWVVDGSGALHRFDHRGEPTGAWAIDANAVAQDGPMLCVTTRDGALACGLDRFDPRGCEQPSPPDLSVLGEGATGDLHMGADGTWVCAVPEGEQPACLHLQPVCERHCLRYPVCGGPLRCVDPCESPDSPPIEARPLEEEFFHQLARLR